jgi:inhibitor of KinA
MFRQDDKQHVINFLPLGDQALVIRLGTTLSTATHRQVRRWSQWLEKEPLPGIIDWLPTYTNITLYYDSREWTYADLVHTVRQAAESLPPLQHEQGHLIRIPVCYGRQYGPDLEYVAEYHGISTTEVIERHTQVEYTVFMIGFAPGFPYLGGMDPSLATPRLESPRRVTPAGSVGIAGEQTGVYPQESPGGWRIIGRTPLRLFDLHRASPSLLKAGYRVRFQPVDEAQYEQYEQMDRTEFE